MATIPRRAYAEMFGPTVGDRVRLADTGLVVEVEEVAILRRALREEGQHRVGRVAEQGAGHVVAVAPPRLVGVRRRERAAGQIDEQPGEQAGR